MSFDRINAAYAKRSITGSLYGPRADRFSVSYWVDDESYWHFAGEFPTRAQANRRKDFLKNSGIEKVRVRKI